MRSEDVVSRLYEALGNAEAMRIARCGNSSRRTCAYSCPRYQHFTQCALSANQSRCWQVTSWRQDLWSTNKKGPVTKLGQGSATYRSVKRFHMAYINFGSVLLCNLFISTSMKQYKVAAWDLTELWRLGPLELKNCQVLHKGSLLTLVAENMDDPKICKDLCKIKSSLGTWLCTIAPDSLSNHGVERRLDVQATRDDSHVTTAFFQPPEIKAYLRSLCISPITPERNHQ